MRNNGRRWLGGAGVALAAGGAVLAGACLLDTAAKDVLPMEIRLVADYPDADRLSGILGPHSGPTQPQTVEEMFPPKTPVSVEDLWGVGGEDPGQILGD